MDPFRALVVQNFEGVAVEDGDDGTGEFSERGIGERRRRKHVSSTCVTMPAWEDEETGRFYACRSA
jgi:hypothetical protein